MYEQIYNPRENAGDRPWPKGSAFYEGPRFTPSGKTVKGKKKAIKKTLSKHK